MVFDFKVDSIMSSCADHTMLYKSCVKTLRARRKASGIILPSTRIFPVSTSTDCGKSVPTDIKSSEKKNFVQKKIQSLQTAQFFQRARKIHDEISRHKQLLHDHRGRYLGQINDPSSMTQEQCVCMDKIISNNLNAVEKQIVDLESRVHASLVQVLRRATNSLTRPGDPGSNGMSVSPAAETNDSSDMHNSGKPNNLDVEWCMAITVAIVQASLADLNTNFAAMKQARSYKQSVKAKLMRLQRPSCVEKDSTVRLRKQQQHHSKQDSDSDRSHGSVPTNNRKKVQFEDWRDDEDILLINGSGKKAEGESRHTGLQNSNSTVVSSKAFASTDDDDNMDKLSGRPRSRFNNEEAALSRPADDQTISYQDSSTINGNGSSDASLAALSDEECQMLEQENDQLYNELQSTHDEVKQMTKQVAELARLQDFLTENVEEQAVMADTVQNLVVTATDNVQEGNEQIREAMQKDTSFRVRIMFFLIVMSFTILFLPWQIREAMRKDASFLVWIMFFLIVMSFTILFLLWQIREAMQKDTSFRVWIMFCLIVMSFTILFLLWQIREAMHKDTSFRVWIMFFLIVMSFTILFLIRQIREAMRKDASFRVWIMFFLIVMSFTILFLDWYND